MQLEEYIADNMIELCEKRGISKYRLAQMTGIAQSSLGRIMAKESLPSLPTLEKICEALDVTLSQFFCEGDPDDLTQPQSEVLAIWNDLSVQEQEVVLAMLRGLIETVRLYIRWTVSFLLHFIRKKLLETDIRDREMRLRGKLLWRHQKRKSTFWNI